MGDARIVMLTLIDEGLLSPGPKKLYVSYYRKRVYADLLPDGSIRFKDVVYTSPVPCALHMKRTLNPSLKTDAGWSSMYSASTGESLKDLKERTNIRMRGTNARSAHKEKRAPSPSPTKERTTQAAATQPKQEAQPCAVCRKEATTDVTQCSACHRKTHSKCLNPPMEAGSTAPWFCEKCLASQANRILEFLQQTRRVLVEKIDEQKAKTQEVQSTEPIESEDVGMEVVEEKEASADDKENNTSDPDDKASDASKCKEESEKSPSASTEVNENGVSIDSISAPGASLTEMEEPEKTDSNKESSNDAPAVDSPADKPSESKDIVPVVVDDAVKDTVPVVVDDAVKDVVPVVEDDAVKDKGAEQEATDVVTTGMTALEAKETGDLPKADTGDKQVNKEENAAQMTIAESSKALSAEEKFLVLVDNLIAEVSSKKDRAHLIANSTGATLVHLEKTQLVQLIEYGKREILVATQSESEEDENDDTDDDHDASTSGNNSEVDALIRIFDLRHQILSSQSQFERTTKTLTKRTEKHLCHAETELMELEHGRVVEASAVMKVVNLISQYSDDLNQCEQKIHHNRLLLESINHRRNFIRTTNINDRFVPSYRYSTKLMTSSSDQLLMTVLLDKLRDITASVNEWMTMEHHFEKMTANLYKSLTLIGTKRKRTGAPVKFLPTPALFAKVKIPPSRRLIERQITNYEVNLNTIRQNRGRMRKTLSGILKIAREEHLSVEIIRMTEILYQKCRDLKAEEEEEALRLKEETEAKAQEEAKVKAKEEAEAKAHEEMEAKAKEEEEAKGNEDAETKAKENENIANAHIPQSVDYGTESGEEPIQSDPVK
ncbi:hypothetical protein BBO99_00008344 [Phytophthora kernoviae]|uniref:PHD-type domain-containing protein n=2 Tax=Phytophthora kernoviae TaxID=325452 RepID=A0A3R7JX91_9STRA|nr:hypothetical protein G195_009603 [Phytophthora kernoviae 00238/432]KAG2516498.1 hypothetical protein JM18_007965 [Phytophthora kernoviae]RLN31393.1 hypothetical protein BBI17_008287 [Phytophthora kernoviae]RLN75415.1 hypothetical protein BBO99_00008344 [Phytophthora kernoviae]